MADIKLISNLANLASFFDDGERIYRIIFCNDEESFFYCTDDEGCEYQITYEEVDLATDKFYKAVEMDPKDYEDVQAISG